MCYQSVCSGVPALVLGKPVAAKPSKIVAGHEADRTNEFLQDLAASINKKVYHIHMIHLIHKHDELVL